MESPGPSLEASQSSDISRSRYLAFVLVLLILGFATRFYRLADWSYYGDEIYTLEEIGDSRTGYSFTVHTFLNPFGDLPVWVSEKLFGENEFASRLPSALFGAVAPAVLCLLAGLIMPRRAALLVGFLVLLHPWHLFKSQLARYYAMAFLLGASGAVGFYLALERNSWKLVLLAGILMLLCIGSHTTGVFVLVALVPYVLVLLLRRDLRPAGLNWRNALLFAAPFLILFFVGLITLFARAFSIVTAGFGENQGETAFGGYSAIGRIVRLGPSLLVFAGVPALVLPIVAVVDLFRRRDRLSLFLASMFVTTLACGFFFCLMYSVERRYLFISMGLWLIGAGYGLNRLLSLGRADGRWSLISVVPLLLVFAYYAPDFAVYYKDGMRPDIRSALQTVAKRAADKDIIVSNCMLESSVRIYAKRPLEFFRLSVVQVGTWSADKLRERTSDSRRTWFILEYRRPGLPPDWVRWLWRNCVCVADLKQHRFGYMEWNLAVFVYDPAWRPPADPAREPQNTLMQVSK